MFKTDIWQLAKAQVQEDKTTLVILKENTEHDTQSTIILRFCPKLVDPQQIQIIFLLICSYQMMDSTL